MEMILKNVRIATLLLGVPLIGSSPALTQTAKHKPDFTLRISTEDRTVPAQKNTDIWVKVKESNISDHPVDAGRTNQPADWYKMVALLDGRPAPKTELYRQILTPAKEGAPLTFSWAFWTIKPGHTQTFDVELSLYFDFSAPGKYAVTFIRGTNPGQPDNVDVKSNTITFIVLPADSLQPTPH